MKRIPPAALPLLCLPPPGVDGHGSAQLAGYIDFGLARTRL